MNRDELIQTYQQRIDQNDRTKLTTEERSFLVQDFVQQLVGLDDPQAIEQLCQDEIELLEAGYGKGTNSTTNYLSKYRSAIAQAVEDGKLILTPSTTHHFVGRKQATGEEFEATNHLAWSLMRYDNSVYVANRKATNVGNNQRQDNPQPFVPDRFLEKASQLLQSNEAETLAVAIAAVTGRRHTEVAVSGQFSLAKHPYLLTFDGQLKKDDPVAYSIVSLLAAQDVIEAIHRFRSFPQVRELQGLTSEDQAVKNFRARVNTRVKQHFQKTEILPILPGFQSVSVHRLRGAYARMIIHYWLPNQGVNEQRFLQFYLGHVEANQMKDASNSNSTSHYFGYRLIDDEGNPIAASGIKLMANPALPSPTDQQLQQQQQANQQLDSQHGLDFSDSEEPPMTPTPDAVDAVAHELDELLHQEPAESSVPVITQQSRQQRQQSKLSKPRLKDLAVNLADLVAAAENLGLSYSKGKGQGYQALLQQLLHNLARAESDFSAPLQSADSPIGGEALTQSTGFAAATQAIAVLTQEMSSLRQQLSDMTTQLHTTQQQLSQAQDEHESRRLLAAEVHSLREQLKQAQADRVTLQAQLDQLTPLQTQHNQMKAELEKAQNILNQFRRLSMGNEPLQVSPTPTAESSTTTAPTPPVAPTISPAPQLATPVPTTSPIREAAAVNVTSSTNQAAKRGTRSYRLAPGKLSPQERILRAIQALIHHNQSCSDPSDQWFVNRQLIAEMSGTNNQTYVKPIFEQPSDLFPGFETVEAAIHHHNQSMGLPNPQHNKGKEKEELQSIYQSFDPN